MRRENLSLYFQVKEELVPIPLLSGNGGTGWTHFFLHFFEILGC